MAKSTGYVRMTVNDNKEVFILTSAIEAVGLEVSHGKDREYREVSLYTKSGTFTGEIFELAGDIDSALADIIETYM